MAATDEFVDVLLGELQDLRDLGDRSKSVWLRLRGVPIRRPGQQDDLEIRCQTSGLACALGQRRNRKTLGDRGIRVEFIETYHLSGVTALRPRRARGCCRTRSDGTLCEVRHHSLLISLSD